jgi:L-alanine-DL-glutamate epimerase-like enolase superfamily enzyme
VTGFLLADDLISPPLPIEGGTARVPANPGLGVALDPAAVRRLAGRWHEVGR